MTDWYALSVEAEYKQQYFQKEAEIDRLLNEMKPVQARKRSFICHLLDKLGEKLVELGTVLRARYGVSAH